MCLIAVSLLRIRVRPWPIVLGCCPFHASIFLRGLKRVDVLQNPLAIDIVVLHFILKLQDVDSVQSATYGLEVDEDLPRRDRCEEGLFVLDIEHLYIVDSFQNKHACLELRFRVHLIVTHTGFPRDLFFTNDGRFVIVRYAGIVDCWPHRGWK